MITQLGTAPWTMTCTHCGLAWDPPNARGKDQPTDASLDRQALQHWQECEARPAGRDAA